MFQRQQLKNVLVWTLRSLVITLDGLSALIFEPPALEVSAEIKKNDFTLPFVISFSD